MTVNVKGQGHDTNAVKCLNYFCSISQLCNTIAFVLMCEHSETKGDHDLPGKKVKVRAQMYINHQISSTGCRVLSLIFTPKFQGQRSRY